MKETREILDKVLSFSADERAILATVIDVRGSGYRLPGARMLILENGDTFGTVSGGCLEADVMERAKKVLESGEAEVFTYDTTEDENSVFSLNMGCRGVIRILLEAVDKNSVLLRTLSLADKRRERQTVVTLVSAENGQETKIGVRVFFSEAVQFHSNNPPVFLDLFPSLRGEIRSFFESGKDYGLHTFEMPEGSFEFAFENIKPSVSLLLFGAGADAIPMVRIAAEAGWQFTVFDHRPAFLTAERFPAAEKLVLLKADGPVERISADDRTAAVIMTHNYGRDREILPALLGSDVFYIGALGPKKRTTQILDEIALAGKAFTKEQIAKLYAPVGLDIGGDTPEGIALSIVSEIQGVLSGRKGGHLRDRNGSIYDRK
jgi:xanthine dehydrogenase accessory factor